MGVDETVNVVVASAPLAENAPSAIAITASWLTDKLLPPALLAIAVSWAIPRALERFRGRREHFYKTVDTLRAQLQNLQAAAALYWNSAHDPKKSQIDEANLEFLLGDVGSLIRLAAEAGSPDLYASPESPAVIALGELIDAVTGGSYRSKKRLPDLQRSSRVNAAALHLLSLLAQARWNVIDKGTRKAKKPKAGP
jgi:hypothetical protein